MRYQQTDPSTPARLAVAALAPPSQPAAAGYDYARFSQLSGQVTDPPEDAPSRIRYRRLPNARPLRSILGASMVIATQIALFVWILLPRHWPRVGEDPVLRISTLVMLCSIYAIEWFRLVNVSTLGLATALARDPVPIRAEPGSRVAFLTTIVPGKEPIEMVRRTLEAALRIRHDGTLHVWLLDEGDDREVREMCAELGVHHFSRRGVEQWNRPRGAFKARTKHGNYNSWLEEHGSAYDFWLSVDTDHVPLPSFAERMLGYFRDPDVAFVVGPQVYGNYDNFVTKSAESQQFVFHGLIQRMANFFRCPMFVGTNNAVRIASLREIGGLRDSITEDMATSLAWHSSRNPLSGKRWKSVYTPDVLAVGEGPSSFTDFFGQQYRWSRGTFEALRGHLWRCLPGLGLGSKLHYLLISSYYPSAAVGWVLGALNCLLYLILGTTGVRVQPQAWLAIYVDLALVQFCFYASNRKHNVSPHEAKGSSGAGGMLISVLAAPVYVAALLGTVTGRKANFVVTPKGDSQSPDGLRTFGRHLRWAGLFAAGLGASLWIDQPQSSLRLWSVALIVVCVTPALIWSAQTYAHRRRTRGSLRVAARLPEAALAAEGKAR
jgi:cellulose synthase/poly-beta-1,6-N-acetylglucosamine synthase-like glycosyltransferase